MYPSESLSVQPSQPERVGELAIAPYLPLTRVVTVGAYELIPFRDIEFHDALPISRRTHVLTLIEAYRLPSSGGAVLGTVVRPAEGSIGDAISRAEHGRLGRALLAGAVSGNAELTVEDPSPNAGYGICTSENALLYGHPLAGTPTSYVIEVGTLARTMSYRTRDGEHPPPPIEPPVELPQPLMATFDDELASTTYALLGSDDEPARQLRVALDWYRIALANSETVNLDIRVNAARTAIETLMGVGDDGKKILRAYGRTVSPDAPTSPYTGYPFHDQSVDLTEEERWMARLSLLRNKLTHGQDFDEELWIYDGKHQLDHLHDRLIRLLRLLVARAAGDPPLANAPSNRVFDRLAEQAAEMLRRAEDD